MNGDQVDGGRRENHHHRAEDHQGSLVRRSRRRVAEENRREVMFALTFGEQGFPAMDTSFPGITDKALKSLATKVNASTDSFKTKKLLRKATGDDNGQAMNLGWHLLQAQLVPAQTSASLLLALESDGMNVARAQALADFLVRVPEGTKGELWPGWTWVLDAFTYQGYGLVPEAFEARFAELPRATRLGLVFVRARRGQRPSRENGLEVMAELARAQATGYGITGNTSMPYWRDGSEVAHELSDVGALRTIALLLGDEADWDRLLLEATRADREHQPCTRAHDARGARRSLHRARGGEPTRVRRQLHGRGISQGPPGSSQG